MLTMQKLSKVYRTHMIETHALRELDLHVREGEFVAVTGPSGSGKTTFLNIAGLLEEFTGGGRFAFVVDDDIATRRPIEIGATSMTDIEIVGGLEVGERIVISGTDDFADAERILISD